jgi:TolA-binding protein
VFLGEVGARRGIAYDSRKLDPEGESFVFRVEASGIYALKFYRQDFAHDLILNDHVQIIAGGAPETTGLGWFNPPTDRSRVVAEPRWPNFLEPSQRIGSNAEQQFSRPIEELVAQPSVTVKPPEAAQPPAVTQPPATTQPPVMTQPPATARPPAAVQPAAPPARNETALPQGLSGNAVAQATPAQPQSPPQPASAAEPVSPDSILKQARDEFNVGRIASAITLLDQFCKSFPSGSDEAWWLYGQCFEANSPNRNMLSALDYYRRLVREYPQSSRLSDARRRIAYLERYYINIQ